MKYDNVTTVELIEQAERLEELGRLEDALGFWRVAAEREPDPVTLCEMGALATRLGRWVEAERALISGRNLAPELPNTHFLLGSLYLERSEPSKAVENFQTAVELGRNPSRLTALGVAQLEMSCVEEARNSLNEALRIDPVYEEAAYNLGLTYRDQEPTKAAKLFEKAVEIDARYSGAHRELGWVQHRLNNEAEAEYHLRKAIELNEFDPWAHIYLGNLLWSNREVATAEEEFKRAINLWPDHSVPYWSLAIFYEYEGRHEEANHFYERALSVDPDDPQANKMFGVYLKDIGETGKAKAYLERAHTIDPDDQSICDILATLT
jgi:tetratricopeptide (TPR) repeat protein